MARKVDWTDFAECQFKETLRYWRERNGSNLYPKKLRKEVVEATNFLLIYPTTEHKSEIEEIRYGLVRSYQIFYREIARALK